MSKRKAKDPQGGNNVIDYRHKNITRINIPPAGLAARGQITKERQVKFAYNPHLAPALRFDVTGKADKVHRLIEKAGTQKLESAEVAIVRQDMQIHIAYSTSLGC